MSEVGNYIVQSAFVNQYGYLRSVLIPVLSCGGGSKEENVVITELVIQCFNEAINMLRDKNSNRFAIQQTQPQLFRSAVEQIEEEGGIEEIEIHQYYSKDMRNYGEIPSQTTWLLYKKILNCCKKTTIDEQLGNIFSNQLLASFMEEGVMFMNGY
ncbi:MAG: hypothetical protein EZS28_026504 [Streblomastix strix]|uniref:Uncharacterized protein n=1 Tax=Streblomastix strix TaxID=222440 RepID=A0A5J4V6J6_9EUKA|nr:MAG: hypothetical protein EZS28_026504 [Streblomastix strix]